MAAAPPAARRRGTVGVDGSMTGTRRGSVASGTGDIRSEIIQVVEKARRAGADEVRVKGLERMLAHECAAEELEKALQNGSAKDVKAAIARAARSGVQKKVLDASRTHLMQMEAGDMLQEAVEKGDKDLMAQAIMHAKAAGFAQSELDAAEDLRAQIEAQEVVKAAMATRQPDAIRYAIKEARKAKLHANDVRTAERLLEQLTAGRDLTQALSRKSTCGREGLRVVLDKAVEAGVSGAEMDRARAAIDHMDAASALKESVKSGDPAAIVRAMDAARAAGVDEKELAAAEKTAMRANVAVDLGGTATSTRCSSGDVSKRRNRRASVA